MNTLQSIEKKQLDELQNATWSAYKNLKNTGKSPKVTSPYLNKTTTKHPQLVELADVPPKLTANLQAG